MSFEIFLQDFSDTPADRSRTVGQHLLAPLLDTHGASVVTPDGSADVYGVDEVPLHSLMFNQIDGDLAWDVIFDVAVAGDWVVLPIGCPVCIIDDAQADSIPDELRELGHVLVHSGSELRAAMSG